VKPRAQFRLRVRRGADIAIGPGKIDLLEAIAKTGSITAAARALGMSYRRAWLLVDTMNRCFRERVVEAGAGGRRGGGARLSASGEAVIRHYRRIERLAARASAAEMRALLRLLKQSQG
jgi:molybdate transport system regulatory protein